MIKKEIIKHGFDKMLGANTIVRRKLISKSNQKKNAFISIINKYETTLSKESILQSQFEIDLSKYSDPYYSIIYDLILLSWGPDIYSLFEFYFYGNVGSNNEEIPYLDKTGVKTFVRTPLDLYMLIEKLYPGVI